MALPPGATARDRWLDLADEARAKRQDALASGNRRMAELWDEEERRLLGLAYSDAPAPANDAAASAGDAPDSDTPETGIDPDTDDVEIASVDDDRPAIGAMILAADTRRAPNRRSAAPKARTQRAAPKRPGPAPKSLPPEKQAENVRKAREAMSNPMVYAFMRAISAAEGDYDQLVGGKRFKGTTYPGEASGAYQITNQKHKEMLAELGPLDFSRDSQDVMGAHIIVTNRDGALDDILRGRLDEAVKKLRGTWPSLPGGNQTHTTLDTFAARFNAMVAQP